MEKITASQYEPLFDLATTILTQGITPTAISRLAAVECLIATTGMKLSSAIFYLQALLAMRAGVVYKKTINKAATHYYLERFRDELTMKQFTSVLTSIDLI